MDFGFMAMLPYRDLREKATLGRVSFSQHFEFEPPARAIETFVLPLNFLQVRPTRPTTTVDNIW
jgi:hypothetical protein